MTSFNTFIAKEYQQLYPGMREIYGSLEKFTKTTIANQGLTPWLESLQGKSISLGLTHNIGKTYIERCDRQPSEIPAVLAQISRLYDIELPVVEGILAKEYWEAKSEHWKVKSTS